MIANPVLADVLAVVVEELSLVGSLFGTRRTPFDFQGQLKNRIISTYQAQRVFLHWLDAVCNRIRSWPKRFYPAYRSRTRPDAECRKSSDLHRRDRAVRRRQ